MSSTHELMPNSSIETVRQDVKTEFDAYNQTYDAAVNSAIAFSGLNVDFFTKVKARYITRVLAAQLGDLSQLDLLDVGCGVGNYHPFFANSVRTVTAVDVSSECIAAASKRNPWVDYRTYDGHRLPFADA